VAPGGAAEVGVEAVFCGVLREVPFAGEAGLVAGLLEGLA